MEFEKRSVFQPKMIVFCQLKDRIHDKFLHNFLQYFPFLDTTIILIKTSYTLSFGHVARFLKFLKLFLIFDHKNDEESNQQIFFQEISVSFALNDQWRDFVN